ncbi:hypothetical protein LguiA_033091 [Lonicera macranthoides]
MDDKGKPFSPTTPYPPERPPPPPLPQPPPPQLPPTLLTPPVTPLLPRARLSVASVSGTKNGSVGL